jgi:hypothetical protein
MHISPAQKFRTVGVIAATLGTPLHKVEYVIRSRGIASLGLAGNARVFDETAVKQIADVLRAMDGKRATSDLEASPR